MDFVAEYEFQVEYRPVTKSGTVDFLSRAVPDGSSPTSENYEGDLVAALYSVQAKENPNHNILLLGGPRHFHGLKIRVQDENKRRSIKNMAKIFMIWEGKFLRRNGNGLKYVPFMKDMIAVLKTFHDDFVL